MSSSDSTRLAIRGQLPSSVRATQTQVLTKGSVKAEIGGSFSKRGKINKGAVRPGLHAPTGPQPFISKGRISNPDEDLSGPLSDSALSKHATSSTGSFGVSFSALDGTNSSGFESQVSFNTKEFEGSKEHKGIKGKSFITTTAVDRMQENPHSSGLETELIGRGHEHTDDDSMMQHTLFRNKEDGFSLTSRKWEPASGDTAAHWGEQGQTASFSSLDDAFERMYRRGVNGVTHFED